MTSAKPLAARPSAGLAQPLLAGLIGRGIQGSRSPTLHMQEADAQGFGLTYRLIDLDADPWKRADLRQALESAERDGFSGVNVTYPFKQDVIPLLDELSEDAGRLGAVNTVLFRDGLRIGHNTDWSGFAENLRRGLPGCGKAQVVLLGAGGAGAAVGYALLHDGVDRLFVFDTDTAKAGELAAKLCSLYGDGRALVGSDLAGALAAADGLVNATPVGMIKHPGTPLSPELLRADQWVADIVYVPIETDLLSQARALGCRTLDGGGMAVFQAAEAFKLFTGREPDAERMRSRFLKDVGIVGE